MKATIVRVVNRLPRPALGDGVRMGVLAVGLLAVFAFVTLGCNASGIKGGTTEISHTEQVTTHRPDGSVVTETIKDSGSASGSEATARGDGKLDAELDTTPPEITLPGGGSAKGSGVSGVSKVTSRLTGWGLIAAGVLLLLGSGVSVYFGLFRAGCILGVGGVGMIVVGVWPWTLFVLIALAVIGGGVYLYAEYRGKTVHEALRAVVAGVANTDQAARILVKDEIDKQADGRDKKVIEEVKIKDGL